MVTRQFEVVLTVVFSDANDGVARYIKRLAEVNPEYVEAFIADISAGRWRENAEDPTRPVFGVHVDDVTEVGAHE